MLLFSPVLFLVSSNSNIGAHFILFCYFPICSFMPHSFPSDRFHIIAKSKVNVKFYILHGK